jgi:hypothetical protein
LIKRVDAKVDVKQKTLNPKFYKCYELDCNLNVDTKMTVAFYDEKDGI